MTERNSKTIRVESYLSLQADGGKMVKLAELSGPQKNYIGACLQIKIFNTMFAGRAFFYVNDLPEKESVFP